MLVDKDLLQIGKKSRAFCLRVYKVLADDAMELPFEKRTLSRLNIEVQYGETLGQRFFLYASDKQPTT